MFTKKSLANARRVRCCGESTSFRLDSDDRCFGSFSFPVFGEAVEIFVAVLDFGFRASGSDAINRFRVDC